MSELARLVSGLVSLVNRVLGPLRVQLVSRSELAAIDASTTLAPDDRRQLAADGTAPPAGAREYLVSNNARLIEFRRRYEGHPVFSPSRWTREFVDQQIDLAQFRADNPYVWSKRDAYVREDGRKRRSATRDINYVVSAYYTRWHDQLDVLGRCADDGLFGNPQIQVEPGLRVSRDLLDSALELDFLDRHLDLTSREGLTVLDIGAGYGRFSHRLVESLPGARALCADGVPESTFLAEYYLRFRGVADRAQVVPLDELKNIQRGEVQLAVNIHSWSECSIEVIRWWVNFIAELRVPSLLVVPNDGEQLLSLEADGSQLDFTPLLRDAGYQRAVLEPKYGGTACQQLGVYPTHYHLFALTPRA